MKTIDGNTALRSLIPNTFKTVPGEPSWFEKLYPFLEQAEEWLCQNITGEAVLNSIPEMADIDPIRRMAAKIVTTHGMLTAVPSLDLVLTPNGFGIVNTSNVAPASKDRVERLMASLEKERDEYIESIIPKLAYVEGWLQSAAGRFYAATLFPTPSVCRRLNIKEGMFRNYLNIQAKLVTIEQKLAEKYFSEEQMEAWRLIVIKRGSCHDKVRHVISKLQSLEMMVVSGMEVHNQSFFDLVNIIRQDSENFPEWHASSVAELYTPTVFENKKESTGYWF